MTKLRFNRFRYTALVNYNKVVVWTQDKFSQIGYGPRQFFLKDVEKKE
jgi:hypothetical protein